MAPLADGPGLVFRSISRPGTCACFRGQHPKAAVDEEFIPGAVLLIAVLGFLMGRPAFLDIVLVYALINFITTIAIMKFFKYERLGHRSGEDLGGL